MRNVYLIRHGLPDFPGGRRMCLGTTDLPLSKLGSLQGTLLGIAFRDRPVTVFSSPLLRARQTAEAMGKPVTVLSSLRELHMGQWDGLTFDEIRCRFPALYAARATDKTLPFPDSEDHEAGRQRFADGIRDALSQCRGDVAIVTHSGVMELYLGTTEKAPYGSVTHLQVDGDAIHVCAFGKIPHPDPNREFCDALLQGAAVPEAVERHSRAVTKKALRMAKRLNEAGYKLDLDLIETGALLHDIARTEELHAQQGSYYLKELGYPDLARVIRNHCDCPGNALDEDAIVYLADKLTDCTRDVTIEARFQKSLKKCRTEEEQGFHHIRHQVALKIMALYRAALGDPESTE